MSRAGCEIHIGREPCEHGILVSGAQRAAGRTGESCREKWGVGSAQAVFRVLSFKTRAPKERVQRPGQGPGADREQPAGSLLAHAGA